MRLPIFKPIAYKLIFTNRKRTTAIYKIKLTSITTVRNHILRVACFPTPLPFHYPQRYFFEDFSKLGDPSCAFKENKKQFNCLHVWYINNAHDVQSIWDMLGQKLYLILPWDKTASIFQRLVECSIQRECYPPPPLTGGRDKGEGRSEKEPQIIGAAT